MTESGARLEPVGSPADACTPIPMAQALFRKIAAALPGMESVGSGKQVGLPAGGCYQRSSGAGASAADAFAAADEGWCLTKWQEDLVDINLAPAATAKPGSQAASSCAC